MINSLESAFHDFLDAPSRGKMVKMDNKIILRLSGNDISIESLGEALRDTDSLLTEIDCNISGEKTIRWNLNALNKGSAIVEAIPVGLPVEAQGDSTQVLQRFWGGLHLLDSSSERPEGFSDKALYLVKKLVEISKGVSSMAFMVNIGGKLSEATKITGRIAANVDDIIGEARESIGSIEGILEVVHGHNEKYFNIYDTLSKRAVKCLCKQDDLVHLCRDAYQKRVSVTGRIFEDAQGRPKRVKVESYRILRDKDELPQAEDVRGLYAKHYDG